MKDILYASSGTRAGIEKLASAFFYSNAWLEDRAEGGWHVHTAKGRTGLVVLKRKNRFRLVRLGGAA